MEIPRIVEDLWVIPLGKEPFDKEEYKKRMAKYSEGIKNGTIIREPHRCDCCQ